jgi:hypothetical protein
MASRSWYEMLAASRFGKTKTFAFSLRAVNARRRRTARPAARTALQPDDGTLR